MTYRTLLDCVSTLTILRLSISTSQAAELADAFQISEIFSYIITSLETALVV